MKRNLRKNEISPSHPPVHPPAAADIRLLPDPHPLSLVTSASLSSDSSSLHHLKNHHVFESMGSDSQVRLSERLKIKLREQLQQRQRQQQDRENRSTPLLISGTGQARQSLIHRFNSQDDGNSILSSGSFRIPNAGEMGKPVQLDKDKMSKDIQSLIDKGWEDNAFNQYVSDMISITRSLPDVRDPK